MAKTKLNPDRTNFNPAIKDWPEAKFKKAFEASYTGDYKKYYAAIKAGKFNYKDRLPTK